MLHSTRAELRNLLCVMLPLLSTKVHMPACIRGNFSVVFLRAYVLDLLITTFLFF